MRTTYDPAADAVYIKVGGAAVAESEELRDNIVLDLDVEGRIVGVEILNASLKLTPGEWLRAPLPATGALAAAE